MSANKESSRPNLTMDTELLEKLNLNYKELGSALQDLDENFQNSESKAGKLAAGYVILEAVFCTLALQYPSVALREKWWIPLSFSASVTLVFWLTFISVVGDCLRIRRQQDLTFIEQENLYRKMYSIRTGQRENDSDPHRLVKPFEMVQYRRYAFVGVVLSSLLCVTVVVLYAIVTIPQQ